MNETFRSTCPMTNLLDLVGDKWSLIVIRDLLLCRNTFSQLIQDGEENISTNILTNRLKKLKNYGFIDFVKNRNDHKVKHYYLTDKGIDLNRVLHEMSLWSSKYLTHDFNEVSTVKFEQNKDLSRDLILSNERDAYKKERAKLLEFHLNPESHKVQF